MTDLNALARACRALQQAGRWTEATALWEQAKRDAKARGEAETVRRMGEM